MKFKRNPRNVTLLRDLNLIEEGNIFNMYCSEMRENRETQCLLGEGAK